MKATYPMLVLSNLKAIRVGSGIGRALLSRITTIHIDRLRDIELRTTEPWFDETLALSRVLNTNGILPLISSDDLTTLAERDPPIPSDEQSWREGRRAPLSLAVRIAARYGLTDPADLVVSPHLLQVWDVVEHSERVAGAGGQCPWCGEAGPHLPTCLPNNLLKPHSSGAIHVEVHMRSKAAPGRRKGARAYGLKALRLASDFTQKQVAEAVGLSSNHYARTERGELSLSIENADKLAEFYGVSRALIFVEPGGARDDDAGEGADA